MAILQLALSKLNNSWAQDLHSLLIYRHSRYLFKLNKREESYSSQLDNNGIALMFDWKPESTFIKHPIHYELFSQALS